MLFFTDSHSIAEKAVAKKKMGMSWEYFLAGIASAFIQSKFNSIPFYLRTLPKEDVTPLPSQDKKYLKPELLECSTPEYKLREIVQLPEGVNYNEWLASHCKLIKLAFLSTPFPHSLNTELDISKIISLTHCQPVLKFLEMPR